MPARRKDHSENHAKRQWYNNAWGSPEHGGLAREIQRQGRTGRVAAQPPTRQAAGHAHNAHDPCGGGRGPVRRPAGHVCHYDDESSGGTPLAHQGTLTKFRTVQAALPREGGSGKRRVGGHAATREALCRL